MKFNCPVKPNPRPAEKPAAPGRSAISEVGGPGLPHFQLGGGFARGRAPHARGGGLFPGVRPHQKIELRLPDFQLMLDGFDAGWKSSRVAAISGTMAPGSAPAGTRAVRGGRPTRCPRRQSETVSRP